MINSKALYVTKISFIEPKKFSGFAVNLQIWKHGEHECGPGEVMLAFSDTGRGHMIVGKMTEDKDGTITLVRTFRDEDGKPTSEDTFIFKLCTLDDYRRTYYKLAGGGKEIAETCTSTEDLWEYYYRNFSKPDFY